jgi:hypothetical protein
MGQSQKFSPLLLFGSMNLVDFPLLTWITPISLAIIAVLSIILVYSKHLHLQVGVVSDYDLLALDSMPGIQDFKEILISCLQWIHIKPFVWNCTCTKSFMLLVVSCDATKSYLLHVVCSIFHTSTSHILSITFNCVLQFIFTVICCCIRGIN